MATAKVAPLLVLVGETASGKTELAIRLAQKFAGEIISADSQSVRQGTDIGSAKPTAVERAMVPHHLIDIVGPNDRFTAADFKTKAIRAIDDISGRGKLPIMAGGTGLYIDSVLYDYSFGVEGAPDRRAVRKNSLALGLKVEREELVRRITERVDAMLAAGLENEVRDLADHYGWDCLALKGVGYAQWKDYFADRQNLAKTRQKIIQANVGLAKRQRTWFKRNNSIHWLSTPVKWSPVVELVTTELFN